MNRNVESHFSMLPSADISRSRFDRSQDIKLTCDVGELVPFFVDSTVMPGDTFDITTSKVIRLQTLIDPVFDNLYADFYWFFIPHRLVWQHWRELMGENTASAWIPQTQYTVPQIKAYSSGYGGTSGYGQIRVGSVFDYMGIPTVNDSGNAYEFEFSSLPYRAYCMTFNEWFRDENLTDPVNWSDGDADVTVMTIQGMDPNQGTVLDGDKCFKVAKFHDYFTSCLPSAQKGPPVQIPAGFDVSVGPGWPVGTSSQTYTYGDSNSDLLDRSQTPLKFWGTSANDTTTVLDLRASVTSGTVGLSTTPWQGTSAYGGIYPSNLYAYPASNQQTGLYMLVNDLRYAFQLQKLYERDARGGRVLILCLHVKKIEEKIWKAA